MEVCQARLRRVPQHALVDGGHHNPRLCQQANVPRVAAVVPDLGQREASGISGAVKHTRERGAAAAEGRTSQQSMPSQKASAKLWLRMS